MAHIYTFEDVYDVVCTKVPIGVGPDPKLVPFLLDLPATSNS